MADESKACGQQRRRLGAWLPTEEQALADFRVRIMARARERHARVEPASVVREFHSFIDRDAVLRMNLTRAIDQAMEAGYQLGYANIEELLIVMDYVTTYAPPFSESSAIILPLNGLLEWPMCMPSGYAVFRDPAFNRHLKRVLDLWCGFLNGPHSRRHLTEQSPDGWFCPEALKKTGMQQFLCDPAAPYWGFSSWNDFFTRRFKPGARPVHEPDNPGAIANACEAAPYAIRGDVKRHDKFWIKSQPYSLEEIFTGRELDLAERFVGGTVYQAYLGAQNYHRWHAPVAGRISKAYLVDGTYYSNLEAEGENPHGLNESQGYTTAVAARAIIVIEADEPALGQVACVFVGMAEVSSCVIDVVPGLHVEKGAELGYFQFGGSTYCLVFEAGVIQSFGPQPPFEQSEVLPVNAYLATAR
jgi:phosphatidylserine decarboxylase